VRIRWITDAGGEADSEDATDDEEEEDVTADEGSPFWNAARDAPIGQCITWTAPAGTMKARICSEVVYV
jgi:hypothetical protein